MVVLAEPAQQVIHLVLERDLAEDADSFGVFELLFQFLQVQGRWRWRRPSRLCDGRRGFASGLPCWCRGWRGWRGFEWRWWSCWLLGDRRRRARCGRGRRRGCRFDGRLGGRSRRAWRGHRGGLRWRCRRRRFGSRVRRGRLFIGWGRLTSFGSRCRFWSLRRDWWLRDRRRFRPRLFRLDGAGARCQH